MNSYEKIYALLVDDISETRGPGRSVSKVSLGKVPQRKQRHLGFGLGTGPHGGHDPGEGSPEDVMTTSRTLAILRQREPTLTGIALAQVKKHIANLEAKIKPPEAENASTEVNMAGYERIYEVYTLLTKRKKKR